MFSDRASRATSKFMPLRPPNEDLFEHTRMTFGEHLEELRKVLFRSLLGLAVGMLFGMFFADRVVRLLETPLTRAITRFTITQASDRLKQTTGGVIPLEFRELLGDRLMAPRRVLVDREQLARALGTRPTQQGQTNAQPPTRFTEKNLSADQVRAVCQKLATDANKSAGAAAGEGSEVAAVWSALNDLESQTVRGLSAKTSIDGEDIRAFANMLNRVASQSDLYANPAFAARLAGRAEDRLFSSLETVALTELHAALSRASAADAALLRSQLNQWLLWSALAPELPRPDVAFAEIDIWESVQVTAQSLSATEAFMIWMKAGLILGFVLASPWIFYQLWSFVAAGLYPHERRYVYYYLPISLGLFLGGAALAFFFVFDPVLKFLLTFNASLGIDPQPRIGDWMSFVLMVPLGFGIAFQLPIVMLFLNLLGIFTIRNYLEKWRIAVFVIFFVSMVLTPAEPISMILMAIPLTGLYFLGIAMCRWMQPNRNPYRQVYEP
jgi:sec-independent protein translocase protein TatC